MENRVEKKSPDQSPQSPRTPRSARTASEIPSHNAVRKKFSVLFDLLDNKDFKSALKATHTDEFIPFLKEMRKILSHKSIKVARLDKLKKFFAPANATGFFEACGTQCLNLNEERLKVKFLLMVERDPLPPQEEIVGLLTSLLYDSRMSILNTLSGNHNKYEEFTTALSNMDSHNDTRVGFLNS